MKPAHVVANNREWNSWCSMNARCSNPRYAGFNSYGARGVIVCAEWRGGGRQSKAAFERFLAYIGSRPTGTTLQLKDPNGHFEPGNVQWSPRARPLISRMREVCAPGPIENSACFRGLPPVFVDEGRAVEIPLTRGQRAVIDVDDLSLVRNATWYARWNVATRSFYAQSHEGRANTKMHRVVLSAADPTILVDHENHDTLCNRRHNLRVATFSQNSSNAKPRRGTASIFKGVTRDRAKWVAQIQRNGIKRRLGTFYDEASAALAYDKAALEIHGEFAFTNARAGLLPNPVA